VQISHTQAQEKIIEEGDSWFYYDSKTPPDNNWFRNNGIEKQWSSGVSPLGYGDSVVKTVLDFGEDEKNKPFTTYYKKTFVLDDPYKFLLYKVNIQKDDGIVVYINGNEITRIDMPDGAIDHYSPARGLIVSGKMEEYVHTIILTPDNFKQGLNTISTSVHKARAYSADCIFNLEMVGEDDPALLPLLLKEGTFKNLKLHSEITGLHATLEIEKKELQLAFIYQSRRNILIILIILSVLFGVLLVGFYFKIKSFKAKEKNCSNQALELQRTIKEKDQEMMSLSLNSLNSQQYLKELKKDLDKIISDDVKNIQKNIKSIMTQLEFSLEANDDWDNLKKHFNAVHAGFIEVIVQRHPALSETEIRHCVFMRLQIQTKEIARILHIDPRSVQASRYRIKKKMELKDGVDLREYLQSF